jgi:hypothetical protein
VLSLNRRLATGLRLGIAAVLVLDVVLVFERVQDGRELARIRRRPDECRAPAGRRRAAPGAPPETKTLEYEGHDLKLAFRAQSQCHATAESLPRRSCST